MVKVEYSKPDEYGQKHPIESPELIKEALAELDAELSKLPEDSGWKQAKKNCAPELVDDEHKLTFLRCEVFKVNLALKRIVKYWDKRIEIYGEDKAFLPITLSAEDEHVYKRGMIKYHRGAHDKTGRSIIFADAGKQDNSKYTRKQAVRVLWYIAHECLRSPASKVSQKKGYIFFLFNRHAKFSQFDRQLGQMGASSIRGCLPCRISAIHILDPPTFFRATLALMKVFVGPLLKRNHVHPGSNQRVVASLEKMHFTKENIPSEVGGDYSIDYEAELEERKQEWKEQAEKEQAEKLEAEKPATQEAEKADQKQDEMMVEPDIADEMEE